MARKIKDRTPFAVGIGDESNGVTFLESSLIGAVGWYAVKLRYRKFEGEYVLKPDEIIGRRLAVSDGGRTVGAFKLNAFTMSEDTPRTIETITLEACE